MEEINRIEQLLLHAGLGAITAKLTNNDMLSGAVAGVVGEVVGSYAKENGIVKNDGIKIAGFASTISSMFTGLVQGQEGQTLTDNIYNAQRIGENAAENNAYRGQRGLGGGKPKNNKKDSFSDKHNIQLLHEQWFFEDKPENIGYFGKGAFDGGEIRSDDEKFLNDYIRIDEESYDDDVLREALQNINKNKYINKYNLLFNNCQDFSEDLRQEYFKILNNKK